MREKAKAFKRWIFQVIKALRKASGLEAYQVFRLFDKEHQKAAMARIHDDIPDAARVDYIKANGVANKAVSTKHGFPKMVKKGQMSPEMLADRQPILADTVRLMAMKQEFGLDLSVSDTIYRKYAQ